MKNEFENGLFKKASSKAADMSLLFVFYESSTWGCVTFAGRKEKLLVSQKTDFNRRFLKYVHAVP